MQKPTDKQNKSLENEPEPKAKDNAANDKAKHYEGNPDNPENASYQKKHQYGR